MSLRVLRSHGWSLRALAREFGLNWRTVKREVEAEEVRRYPERGCPAALTPAQLAHVERRLGVCPGLRGTILYGELVADYGYQGSYPSLSRQLRRLRPAVVADPVIRFETDPGRQVQVDWAHLGRWPLGERLVELYGMVAILGYSRRPAFRFATDLTRPTTLEKVALCLDDLGGAPHEVLTDRDPAFVVGQTADGRAILAPEWVDLAAVLGLVPRACRPYRAQTKGKVERMVRELKEGFLPWLTGQVMPRHPTLTDYDRMAQRWVDEVACQRRHRTTGRVVGEAWMEEQPLLRAIPGRILAQLGSPTLAVVGGTEVDPEQRRLGEQVEVRDLAEYEEALG